MNIALKPATKAPVEATTPRRRAEVVEAHAGDEGEIARDERKNAGRREGDQPGGEGDDETGEAELDHRAVFACSRPCSKPVRFVSPTIRVTTETAPAFAVHSTVAFSLAMPPLFALNGPPPSQEPCGACTAWR